MAWSFGKIFKSKWDSTTVVVKTIWPNLLTHKGTCEAFLKEIEVTSSICHPNIITCMGANGNSMPIFIVLKYMPLGSLYDLFQNELTLSYHSCCRPHWNFRSPTACSTSTAGTWYWDLKLPNILLDNKWTAKISNLGMVSLKKATDGGQHAVGIAGDAPGLPDAEPC